MDLKTGDYVRYDDAAKFNYYVGASVGRIEEIGDVFSIVSVRWRSPITKNTFVCDATRKFLVKVVMTFAGWRDDV